MDTHIKDYDPLKRTSAHTPTSGTHRGLYDAHGALAHQLEYLTTELEESLKQHVASVSALLESLRRGGYVANEPTTRSMQLQTATLGVHMLSIQQFLERHIRNTEMLQADLGKPDTGADSTVISSTLDTESEDGDGRREDHPNGCHHREREDHSSNYSNIVLMSTFTAGLIVAFLQLMYSMLPPVGPESTQKYISHYYMGFGFGFVGLVWNLCEAVVAGANTIVQSTGLRRRGSVGTSKSNQCVPDEQVELRSFNVDVVIDDGARMERTEPRIHGIARLFKRPWFKRERTFSNGRDSSDTTSARERYARRSVVFAFAQFFGSATFGVCIGILYYPLHSGHILAFVPMILLTGALIMAAWDLLKGVERRRKKAD